MSVYTVLDVYRVASLLQQHQGRGAGFKVDILALTDETQAAGGYALPITRVLNGPEPVACDYDWVVLPAMEGPWLKQCLSSATQPAAAGDHVRRVTQWLQGCYDAGAQVLAMSTGVYWLAQAQLYPQAVLATHWAYVRLLGRHFPHVQFAADTGYLHAQRVWSAGSLSAMLDVLLAWIALSEGPSFAQQCAAHLLLADPHLHVPTLPECRNHQDTAMLALQNWLDQHYASAITIETMAQRVNLAVRTVKRRFQAATGMAPNAYLQALRVAQAKTLLVVTEQPIKTIAYEVGYDNVSFFVKLFKQHTGQTPGNWRKNNGLIRP